MFSLSLESLRSAFLNAAAWTGLEWLRGILLTGFPWNGLGVPMASLLSLIQSADLVGVTGLSFLPVFCACIAYNTALRFREEARTSRVRPHMDFFCAIDDTGGMTNPGKVWDVERKSRDQTQKESAPDFFSITAPKRD